MAEGRILGLDYGSKTVGAAVSDPLFITAQGLTTIKRKHPTKYRQTIAAIREICEEYHIIKIVLGLPLGLDGIEGDRCQVTRAFGDLLVQKLGIPVDYQDERFTTIEAESTIIAGGKKNPHEVKQTVDQAAAVLILETYMLRHGKN
ncbi:MAG: Holliday junction resolvase RuvX [Lachnospiraceae bacterium]|uniref:Putative pre-16S rRNA nuclease n=1 Tax=Candidatus Weimeria bifida TaxID=2599074 RepID=A0A6N7IYP1_9FIRM|nr:Holliday junction resolvase RuvX [Candidatus Weimeria bifida]RRF96366.1 MAG: Holliday junction resolvase RuvX [Lachnospiraceae bacterium]